MPDADMISVVSNDAVIEVVGTVIVAALGIMIEANRRWNNRIEKVVSDHSAAATSATQVVATSVAEIKVAQDETNRRLHSTREQLARLEGTVQFVMGRQSENLDISRGVAAGVEEVHQQLVTNQEQEPNGH